MLRARATRAQSRERRRLSFAGAVSVSLALYRQRRSAWPIPKSTVIGFPERDTQRTPLCDESRTTRRSAPFRASLPSARARRRSRRGERRRCGAAVRAAVSQSAGARSRCAMCTCLSAYDAVCRSAERIKRRGICSMIGRLNHVAIAVRDIAKARPKVYRDTLGAKVSAKVHAARARRDHCIHRACPTPRSSCSSRSARTRRSPNSSSETRTAASTMSATRCPTSAQRATRLKAPRRARARRRRAEDRRPRQAGAVPASEGFLRHAGRARAGLKPMTIAFARHLFHHLVGGAVRRAAVGRARPARERRDRARQRAGRAGGASGLEETAMDHDHRRHRVCDFATRSTASICSPSTG